MATVAMVFLRPLNAQTVAAKLELMTGQVSILTDGVNLSSAKPLFVGSGIQPKQVVITGADSYARFHLEDGSSFEVFENSKVVFREDYPSWGRLLQVIIGRIKVMIDHTKGPNPNSVTTPTAVISVRGTVFDVAVEDADGTTLVSVDEGLVQVRNITAVGAEPLLKAGESVRIFRGQGLIGKQVDHNGLQKLYRAANEALRVLAQQRPGGIPIGGSAGGNAGGTVAGIPGARGDKGKTGSAPAPPPAPPASPTTGH